MICNSAALKRTTRLSVISLIIYTVTVSNQFWKYSMSLVQTGSKCLDLIANASQCIKSNPKAAQKHLAIIKQTVPPLLDLLHKREKELETKRDELQREESSLERQINSKEASKKRHRWQINELEAQKARKESLLEEAQEELRQAESKKHEAERKKDNVIAGTVGGGVGAIVLGVFFPPSLALTVPAVAAAGTISITEAVERVDSCRGWISSIKGDINEQCSQIQEANGKISNIQREISGLSSKQRSLYAQRGELRNEIVFLQKAVTYFADLQVAVEEGRDKTDLLHRIVAKVNERQQYRIIDSKGCTFVLGSFKEAWGRVEDKIMHGDKDGYTRIEFVQLPQLE